LRIQALTLIQTRNDELIRDGLSLTDRFMRDYPDDLFAALVHEHRAEAYEHLDEISAALQSYRDAMSAERVRPRVRSQAWLRFGWLVARRRLKHLYGEAETLLDEGFEPMPFPYMRFQYHATRAIILCEKGFSTHAQREAVTALEAAGATQSGLRFHSKIGLVRDVPMDIKRCLELIALDPAGPLS